MARSVGLGEHVFAVKIAQSGWRAGAARAKIIDRTMTAPKYKKTSQHCIEGQLDLAKMAKMVCQLLPTSAPEIDVKVEFFVRVPSGGDYSNTTLNIVDHPVQFRATWSETNES